MFFFLTFLPLCLGCKLLSLQCGSRTFSTETLNVASSSIYPKFLVQFSAPPKKRKANVSHYSLYLHMCAVMFLKHDNHKHTVCRASRLSTVILRHVSSMQHLGCECEAAPSCLWVSVWLVGHFSMLTHTHTHTDYIRHLGETHQLRLQIARGHRRAL